MPALWKKGDIEPVEKPQNPGKVRPVTLLQCPGKIAEAMVLPRLEWRVGPLHPHIFGFVRGSSTGDCIMTLLALVNNRTAVAVFLDLEKAFEMADHTTILDALVRKGLGGGL